MGFEIWDIGIPVMLVAVCTVGLGGLFTLVAWKEIVCDWHKSSRWDVSAAVHAFSAAVYLIPLDVLFLKLTSSVLDERYFHAIPLAAIVDLFVVAASFILVTTSMVLVRRNSRPGNRAVRMGSMVLFVVDAVGCIGVIMGLRAGPGH